MVVFSLVLGVRGQSGGGVEEIEEDIEGIEEGFFLDSFISNITADDYELGSGDFFREPFRDIAEFPVCVTDDDCEEITKEEGTDYRCFQYMCYPWGHDVMDRKFRSCKRRSDCQSLLEDEGGDGEDGDCYRHHDRRNVFAGICLHSNEILSCSEHRDCPSHLRCTNFYCGEPHYYQALRYEACPRGQDSFCQDLLLGTSCCFDFSGELSNHTDSASWDMRCCDEEAGAPVIPPKEDLEEEDVAKVNHI